MRGQLLDLVGDIDEETMQAILDREGLPGTPSEVRAINAAWRWGKINGAKLCARCNGAGLDVATEQECLDFDPSVTLDGFYTGRPCPICASPHRAADNDTK
jgi:hypothetical protein